jgi:hypothetical protein
MFAREIKLTAPFLHYYLRTQENFKCVKNHDKTFQTYDLKMEQGILSIFFLSIFASSFPHQINTEQFTIRTLAVYGTGKKIQGPNLLTGTKGSE